MPQITVKDANNVNQTINTINNNGQTTMANSQPVVLASDQSSIPISPVGIGVLTAVPAGSANGTVIGTPPTGYQGVRFLMPVGASITFVRATSQPGSPPTVTWTISNAISGPTYDEPLAGGMNVYITAITGSPLFFWL